MNQEELQSLANPRVSYEQRMQEIQAIADEMPTRYGNPPPEVEAQITDANGNRYKGTLYLVKEDQ